MRAKHLIQAATILTASLVSTGAMAEMSCTLDISSTELGVIVTIGGGHGTLYCDGHTHRIRVGGLTLGGMGLSGIKASGTVRNLQKLGDFPGTYTGGTAGATAVAGSAVLTVENKKGVRIELQGSTAGADVKLGASGLKLSFE